MRCQVYAEHNSNALCILTLRVAFRDTEMVQVHDCSELPLSLLQVMCYVTVRKYQTYSVLYKRVLYIKTCTDEVFVFCTLFAGDY